MSADPAPTAPAHAATEAVDEGAAILADAMTVRYQGTPEPAVSDVSFRVAPGEGLVVTGAEGCGKSTVIRAVIGLIVPMTGTLTVLGGDPFHDPALRRRIGYCPEKRAFPATMKVREGVALVAALRDAGTRGAVDAALRAAGLPEGDPRRVGALEVEDVRRMSLACALVGDPDVLALDDPWEFPETVAALGAARDRGAAVVLATPDPGGFPAVVGPLLTLPGGGDDE